MLFWNYLVFLLIVAGWTRAHQELVWLEDLNSLHDLRELETALPSMLHFNIKRLSGENIKLHLQENKRLNANAPVYVGGSLNGKHTAMEADVPLISGTKFYQDRSLGAAVKVSCADIPDEACKRVVEGSVYIDGDNYDIKPSSIAYNLRSMGNEKNMLHILRRIEAPKMFEKNGNLRGLYGADFKYIPDEETEGKPNRRGFYEDDDTLLPRRPNVPLQYDEELRSLLHDAEIEDQIKELYEHENRQKRAEAEGRLYAVEIVLVVDSSLWDKYYAKVEANNRMNKDTATMYFLRERLAHIINGVSLRYEEIEDPAMNVYVTISQFLIYKSRNASNPLSPNVETPSRDGTIYADSDVYIDGLVQWVKTAPVNEHDDHVMVITGYELYYDNNINNNGVAGVAYVGGACGSYRVSVQQDDDYFVVTSVAAHELGHNLGADHDGSGSSSDCKPREKFIMAPFITTFRTGEPYSVNPWRFSQCSIDAFKKFFGSVRCFLDHGDYYDKNEWDEHNKRLPGERFTLDEQCKLIRGDNSRFCRQAGQESNEEICRVMKCLQPGANYCHFHAAARGTPCGKSGLNKWCIDGKCVERESIATTRRPVATTKSQRTTTQSRETTSQSRETTSQSRETTSQSRETTSQWSESTSEEPSTTTESTTYSTETTTGSCIDSGWHGWSCQRLSRFFLKSYKYEPSIWCRDKYWAHICCALCYASSHPTTTQACVDEGYHGWSCEKVSKYFKNRYHLEPIHWCSDPKWERKCCNYCAHNAF
ncbi:uncharacterized protein LOC132756985 isoform X2 [Ruditapes philippinarum]|uniref:uncharacterized protein LOC132756985 isoform X2 n=1 Tax=Ruditapes philippinarum TaxID=129788 RepID=UPI00295BE9BB|nr:uncharacterized protein LOC132756985 isoform X2 [Ruditapes philippinarum]